MGLPGGSTVKNLPVNTENASSIPNPGRSPGGGNGNALQSSCLGNPMNRVAWQGTVHGGHNRVRHNFATQQQHTHTHTQIDIDTHSSIVCQYKKHLETI